MNSQSPGEGLGRPGFASLRKYIRPRSASPARPVVERCELCDQALAEDHSHLVELASRKLVCACEACALLFSNQSTAKYRRVPRRIDFLVDFQLTDELWASLSLPIQLAFFLPSTAAGRVVALYPSPAGATEALPPPEAWEMLEQENPVLRDLEPDVEALLVNRVGPAREHYRAGIDHCYKLVGLIRTHWRGLSGGQAVWDEIGRFFTAMKGRATRRASHA